MKCKKKNAAWWWNAAQNMHWIIKLGWILYTHDEFASRDNTKKKIIHALTMNPDKKAAPYSSNRKQREKNLLFMFFK